MVMTDFHRGRGDAVRSGAKRGTLLEVLLCVALVNVVLTSLLMMLSRASFHLTTLGSEILGAEGLVGTTIFSVVGALTMRARLKTWTVKNWMLAFLSSFLTANGGGTLRDALQGIPPFWWNSPEFFVIPLLVSAMAFAVRAKRLPITEPLLRLNDSFATGIFLTIGVMKVAVQLGGGHPLFIFASVFMGAITGIGGGVLRDLILFRKVPSAFVGMGLVNALTCSFAIAVWMANAPESMVNWAWLPAGLLMLSLNAVTAGKTFSYR